MPKEIVVEIKNVMDRNKIANAINGLLDAGMNLIKKKTYTKDDSIRMLAMRTLGTAVNSGVAMVQQETALVRAAIINERMKQLGYGTPPKRIT
jgi:hypothetical protein